MTPKQFVKAYRKYGSIKAVARAEKAAGRGGYTSIRRTYVKAVEQSLMEPIRPGRKADRNGPKPPFVPKGKIRAMHTPKKGLPPKGEIYRYMLSCAQNNTKMHDKLWVNAQALADHYDAEIMVARFLYNRDTHVRNDKTEDKETLYGAQDAWWDDRIVPYLFDERCEIAPGLVWCGELNLSPTAVNPLSSMERYTGRASSILPSVKRAMESVPSAKHEATKFMYTTGTVTTRNYIQMKAGQKAEFDHCYGFLLVEVDSDGNWYCRQLDADSEGTMHDFDVKVKDGKVTTGNRIEAILWGDIHFHWLAPEVKKMAWGKNGMFQALNPKYQFVGDILDFRSRNHHDLKDPFAMYQRHVNGAEDVEIEVIECMEGLREIAPTRGCKTIAVDSNHDRAAERWLKEVDWKKDPVNMEFYMASALQKIQAMKNGDHNFHLMTYWAKKYLKSTAGIRFLQQDESFIICKMYDDGIEMGMHGHLGLNGARGSAKGFSKMGRRANVGHSHSCRIVNGIYQAGTCSVLDMLYNLGPSNWSWSHVITYPNGKQAIVTMWENKWRA